MEITRVVSAHNRTDLQNKIRNFIAETNREPIVFANSDTLKLITPQYVYPNLEFPNLSLSDGDSVTIDGIKFRSAKNVYFGDIEASIDDEVFVLRSY